MITGFDHGDLALAKHTLDPPAHAHQYEQESCDREDRALAGAMRPILTAPGQVPAYRNLNGSAASDWQHPVALVAAAATEQGAGNPDGAVQRLDAAAQLEQRIPSYYGAAWVALGRIMLTTSMLGDCHSAR